MYKVTVINYGVGNLLSVARAFNYCGRDVILADKPQQIRQADLLVLPGVGAFADGMEGLNNREFIEPIYDFVRSGKPFLGICLGMQMLLDGSEEFGEHKGLGLIPGCVQKIPLLGKNGEPHKVPNVGWYELEARSDWNETLLKNTREGDNVYFVHSFMAEPREEKYRVADYDYDGHKIPAVIRSDNISGCQFHPEKSGKVGLKIIKSFLEGRGL